MVQLMAQRLGKRLASRMECKSVWRLEKQMVLRKVLVKV